MDTDSADGTDLANSADSADSVDSADLVDSMDSADSTDSADSAHLADLADSYFNQHLDRVFKAFNKNVLIKCQKQKSICILKDLIDRSSHCKMFCKN